MIDKKRYVIPARSLAGDCAHPAFVGVVKAVSAPMVFIVDEMTPRAPSHWEWVHFDDLVKFELPEQEPNGKFGSALGEKS